ncbi:uncharacterized protein [Engystomops pustulosus]|uniref:uncharacterized protein isoform X1 n=1 Tax=Engystomops pustulosus TaxID=76066 RepID=UPI003AFAD1B8
MPLGTFSYNCEETADILSQPTISTEFLHIQSNEFKVRDFERTSKQALNSQLHCATLSEYLKVQRIPRGLRVPLRPTFFKDNKEFCSKFEQILNKCSLDLMTLTVEFLHKEIANLQEKVSSIETQLQTTVPTEEFSSLQTKLKTSLDTFKKEQETKKRQKFFRDADDYLNDRVYKWQDNFQSYKSRRRRYRSPATSSASSLEGEYQDQSTFSFLGTNRGRPPRGRRGGARDIARDQPPTMATRSQRR